jgi:hypothetical protein
MNDDTIFVLTVAFASAIAVAAVLITVMRASRPAQRFIILLGILAVAAQVIYPPCLQLGVTSQPLPSRRWAWDGGLSYRRSDNGIWIDADRQIIWLLATIAATAFACWLLCCCRRAKGASPNLPPV